jgi:FemAB-related protein (PEP-CTERM system-associated)
MTLTLGTRQDERITIFHRVDPSSWDEYVRSHPCGSHFHLSAWQKMIHDTFGHKPMHMVAQNSQGKIAGVLPLFLVRSRIFGQMLVSAPLASYGGILADSDGIAEAMLRDAYQLAKELQVEFVELRNFRNSIASDSSTPLITKDLYVTFQKVLPDNTDEILPSIPKKVRYEIRQGVQNGLEFRVNDIGMKDFFKVYSASVRNLGTPVFPRRLFANGLKAFGSECKVFSVHWKKLTVAVAWTLFYKDRLAPHYCGSLKEYNHLSVNSYMYFMIMKYARENGYRLFDFGRSKKGTGSFSFKKHWGMGMFELPYQYALIRRQSLPDMSPLNPKFSLGIEVWRRLPLPVTRLVGPMISRHLI